VWLVAGLLVLALLGGGLWSLLGSDGADSPGTDATPTASAPVTPASSGPAGVLVDTGAYIGRNYEEVQQELEAAGLQVSVEDASESDVAALGTAVSQDDVVGTDPTQTTVPPNSTVTLFVAPEDYAPDTGGEDPGNQDEAPAEPTTQAPPRTTAAPTPTPTSGQGNQDGDNGQGNNQDNDPGNDQDTNEDPDPGPGAEEDGTTPTDAPLSGSAGPAPTAPGDTGALPDADVEGQAAGQQDTGAEG
jgi:serine/threonine-protein kinase